MVEVCKTNIKSTKQANQLLAEAHKRFPEYEMNFDLEDCDNILRIESTAQQIDLNTLLQLLQQKGCVAEPLIDSVPEKVLV